MSNITIRKTSKRGPGWPPPAAVVAELSYLEFPDTLGGDGEFSLVLDAAALRLAAAWRCKTWGEFARLVGLTWGEFVKDRNEELTEIFDRRKPRASTPIVFGELWGTYAAVDGFQDPRECAHEFLTLNVRPNVFDDQRLKGVLEWGGSSPGGNVDALTSPTAHGFVLLQQVLHEAGYVSVTLKHNKHVLAFMED
jgi:hypothetical protein